MYLTYSKIYVIMKIEPFFLKKKYSRGSDDCFLEKFYPELYTLILTNFEKEVKYILYKRIHHSIPEC